VENRWTIAWRSRCICRAGRKGKAAKNPGMFRCITPGINLVLGADSLCLSLIVAAKKENGPSLEGPGRGQFGQVIRSSAAESSYHLSTFCCRAHGLF
jgi:hypothetical protein